MFSTPFGLKGSCWKFGAFLTHSSVCLWVGQSTPTSLVDFVSIFRLTPPKVQHQRIDLKAPCLR